jgi:hypothetical protein
MISKRLRYEVMRRDGHRCRYCGATAEDAKLTIDHVVPVALGGSDEPENLVCACADCNSGKTSSSPDAPLVANVADDALRWAKAMERAAELADADRAKGDPVVEAFEAKWNEFYVCDHSGNPTEPRERIPREAGWEQTVRRFHASGLTISDFQELIDVAMGSKATVAKTWRYFCGCAWSRLRERQAVAAALLEVDNAERS